jgi:hypothetical protein
MQELLSSVMKAAPSAGGQAAGSGVTIMNFPSKAAAEAAATQERNMGKEVILNEVLQDMVQGEGSRIVRLMRTLQR